MGLRHGHPVGLRRLFDRPHCLSGVAERSRTGETPEALPNNHRRNPIPNVPLFPLLPSVQIFFAAFCQDQSDPFSLAEKKRTAKLVNLAVLILPDARIVSRRRFSAPHCAASLSFSVSQRCPSLNAQCLLNRVPAARVSRTRGELTAIRAH